MVRRDGPDLSARQPGVFLTCYLEAEAQTVRGLAARLGVSKPAITRALDRLTEFDLVKRKTDPLDRRSVLVQRTPAGMAFLRELRGILRDAASALKLTEAGAQGRSRAHELRACGTLTVHDPAKPAPWNGGPVGADMSALYEELTAGLEALLSGELYSIANAANATAAIYQKPARRELGRRVFSPRHGTGARPVSG